MSFGFFSSATRSRAAPGPLEPGWERRAPAGRSVSSGSAPVPSGGRAERGSPRRAGGKGSGVSRQGRGRLLAQPHQNIAAPGPLTPSGRVEQADPPAGLPALNLRLPGVTLANPDLWSLFPRQSGLCAPLLSLLSWSICYYFLGANLLVQHSGVLIAGGLH